MAVLIPPGVLKDLRKLPEADARRILDALDAIAADLGLRQPFVTKMVGQPGVWRLRKGGWRAVCRAVEGNVVLDRVANRRDACE